MLTAVVVLVCVVVILNCFVVDGCVAIVAVVIV